MYSVHVGLSNHKNSLVYILKNYNTIIIHEYMYICTCMYTQCETAQMVK